MRLKNIMRLRRNVALEENMRELEYPFEAEWILKKKKSIKKALLKDDESIFLEKRIAILGGSTTNDIKNVLELFLLNYGIRPIFYESEYNQYYEDVMFSNEELCSFKPDLIYIHTSNRNITEYPVIMDDEENVSLKLNAIVTKFESMWKRIAEVYRCPIIQNNFELPYYRLMGNREASDIHGKVNFISRLNMYFYRYASEHTDFYINDINYISATYGLDKWLDPFYWHMYKYALCVSAIPVLCYNVANIIKAIFGKNKKALVLDLDNTLWGGVVGDDGVDNLEIGQETSIGQAYSEFQQYIKQHKDMGILLNVCSKNEESNALAGLRHPDALLKPEDFIVIKANWEPKSQNIAQIATELNIMPDSVVFVDDNPAEREIVRQQLGAVAVPEISTVEHYIHEIDRHGYFEVINLSGDDLERNRMYKANAERAKLETSFADYEEYLLSLDMSAVIKPFEMVYMSRIAQLTNKSNQFNLTTRRYSQAEIETIAAEENYITLYGKLEDKFGDNGVVSVAIGRLEEDVCHIELWLMSCRVLKRDMEYAMMDTLVHHMQKRKVKEIRGYYYPTAKNVMVKNFYELQGFAKISEDVAGNTEWKFVIDEFYKNKNSVIKVEE